MKMALIIISIITALLLLSTAICGMWISKQDLSPQDYASSIRFHANSAYATVFFGLVLAILVIVNIKKIA